MKRVIPKIAKATNKICNKTADAVAMFYNGRIIKISKICNKIIQRITKKYLEKDMYSQKKDKKLLMN